jgi:hypothetical protein
MARLSADRGTSSIHVNELYQSKVLDTFFRYRLQTGNESTLNLPSLLFESIHAAQAFPVAVNLCCQRCSYNLLACPDQATAPFCLRSLPK